MRLRLERPLRTGNQCCRSQTSVKTVVDEGGRTSSEYRSWGNDRQRKEKGSDAP